MSEEATPPVDKPKRPRAAQGTKRTSGTRTKPPTPALSAEREAAAPFAAPDTTGSTDPKMLPVAEAPAQPAPAELPIGERWGEFPSKKRQAELQQRMEAWEQEPDHGTRPGPFAEERLSGADVYWLAAFVAGASDARTGRKTVNEDSQVDLIISFHLEKANLYRARLDGANLRGAQLKEAILVEANLSEADLSEADLSWAILRKASLNGTRLEGANLSLAQLKGASLSAAGLDGANLSAAELKGAILNGAQLKGANLSVAQLKGANLNGAQLKGANLDLAQLEGADLSFARLDGAKLSWAQLEGANLSGAHLTSQADLRLATLDVKTQLTKAHLDATLQVADVAWNGVNLIRLPWEQVPRLGDEAIARQPQTREGQRKDVRQRLEGYEAATRAYRQLAIALRSQGITEAADRFTYRAQIMQRKALWWRLRSRKVSKLGAYLFSLFLAVLTGYGFRMSRIVVAYLLLIGGFATAYWSVGVHHPRDISFWAALIVSVTAFHGRVFTNPFAPNIPDAHACVKHWWPWE